MSFLRNLFTNILSILVIGLIFTVIIIVIAVINDDSPRETEHSVLQIVLDGKLNDKPNSSEYSIASSAKCGKSFISINSAINSAIDDESIEAILIEVGEISGGIANLSSLKRSLKAFQKANKKIFVYSDGMSQLGYYLSSTADSIYLHPSSHLEWKGLGAQLMYFKSMLNKIGVKAEPIRVGKFKSAIEPFILDSMSIENEQQVKALLSDLWNEIIQEVSKERSIKESKLEKTADQLGYLLPKEALELGYIDGVKYEDEIWAVLRKNVHNDFHLISVSDYNDMNKTVNLEEDKIVVIYAEGRIVDGKKETDISAYQYTKILDNVLRDENVKAVVFRVNSPGGSAKASEKIWRKLTLINKNIPVIISMGNVAASGGYYIATAGDTILAEKNTITGSIGVFGLMFNAQELTKNIGVNIERVKTNEMSDFPSFDRSLSFREKSRLKKGIEEVYSIFLKRVQDGRGLTYNEVQGLAQGRVWSGNQALKLGLIDKIGGLTEAISIAENAAKLEEYQLIELPKPVSAIDKIIKTFSKQEISLPEPFAHYNYMINNPNFFKEFSKPQSRLPFILSIK
jgi:protease-4